VGVQSPGSKAKVPFGTHDKGIEETAFGFQRVAQGWGLLGLSVSYWLSRRTMMQMMNKSKVSQHLSEMTSRLNSHTEEVLTNEWKTKETS
jgi:hypothetical protein